MPWYTLQTEPNPTALVRLCDRLQARLVDAVTTSQPIQAFSLYVDEKVRAKQLTFYVLLGNPTPFKDILASYEGRTVKSPDTGELTHIAGARW